MYFELQRNAHLSGLKVYSSKDATKFYLAHNASGNPSAIKMPSQVGWNYMLAMTDEVVSAENQLIALARRYTQSKVELGLYRKVLPDGAERYTVFEGAIGRVRAGKGWIPVAHTHYDAGIHRIFHHPAPQDFGDILATYQNNKSWLETIISFDRNGQIVRVPYGFNQSKQAFFVRLPSGQTRYFKDIFQPGSLDDQMKNIRSTVTNEHERLSEMKQLFIDHNLNPDDYYIAFWAMMYGT